MWRVSRKWVIAGESMNGVNDSSTMVYPSTLLGRESVKYSVVTADLPAVIKPEVSDGKELKG